MSARRGVVDDELEWEWEWVREEEAMGLVGGRGEGLVLVREEDGLLLEEEGSPSRRGEG